MWLLKEGNLAAEFKMNRKRDSSELSQDSSGIPGKSLRARSASEDSDSDGVIVVDPEFEEDSEKMDEQDQDGDQPEETAKSYAEAAIKKPKLFIYTTEHAQSPMRFHSFLEFKKTLASRFYKAIMEKSISPEINCDQIVYDREQGNAVITCHNEESAIWLKKTIASIKVDDVPFRAWGEGERPKKFEMRLFVPDTYQNLQADEVKNAVLHYNHEGADTFEVKKEVALKTGRGLEIEVGPLFFQYCRARRGKINFMMGPLDCTPPGTHRPAKKTSEGLPPKDPVEPPTTKQVVREPRKTQKEAREQGTGGPNELARKTKLGGRTRFLKEGKAQEKIGQKVQGCVGVSEKEMEEADGDPGDGEGKSEEGEGSGAQRKREEWQKVERKKH